MTDTRKKPARPRGGYFFGVSNDMTDEEIRAQWPMVAGDEEIPAASWPLYEFRVTGATAEIEWTDWLEPSSIASGPGQVTILRSRIADQAALYGLLSRLREMGLSLQSVTRLEEAGRSGWWRTIRAHLRRVSWALVVAYLLIGGALAPLIVALAQMISPSLSLMALFGVLAGVAYGFSRLDRGIGWRVTAVAATFITVIILVIYLSNEAGVPAGIAIGLLMTLVAGLAIWLMARFGLIRIARPGPDRLAETGAALYEVRVRGQLSSSMWSERFAGMALTIQDDGITVLRGHINSQAGVYSLLASLRDLALPLVSVTQIVTPEKR
jgi:hypothetical protein